ncbi:MAG: exodeoxyribonuclease V subunit gamma [Succinivibrionaceae bacterium]
MGKFTVYHSNDLSVLVKLGNYLIKKDPVRDPFYREQILVQSVGMKTYIFQQLANENGIVAMINYDLLWNYVWKLGKTYVPNFPQDNPYDLTTLTANIISIINKKEIFSKPEFESIKNYILDSNGNINDFRMYQTAAALADIYDQYQIYRRDWIMSWEGKNTLDHQPDYESWIIKLNSSNKLNNVLSSKDPKDYKWQGILWNQYIKPNYKEEYKEFDRVTAVTMLKEFLKDKIEAKKQNSNLEIIGLPKRIFIYGVSSLAPELLEIFLLLGQLTDVHYMLQNPCELYWGDLFDNYSAQIKKLKSLSSKHYKFVDCKKSSVGSLGLCDESFKEEDGEYERYTGLNTDNYDLDTNEIQVGNPLLLSFGKQGRDNLALLMEMTANQETGDIQAFVEPSKDTLLGKIKHDIFSLNNATETSESYVIKDDDESLSIHSCSSPLREVQVLYDNMLRIFERDPDLTPRDVVVMIPKISTYSPFIDSVFGTNSRLLTNEEGKLIKLPYSINDRCINEESPFVGSIVFLLNINNADIKAQDINYLISVEQIRSKFNISFDDVKTIQEMIVNNKIYRWLDDSDSENYTNGECSYKYPSNFTAGLDRLLLGSMMPLSEDDTVYNPEYEGQMVSVIGNFYMLIEMLKKFRSLLKTKRTAEEWDDFIEIELLNKFYKFTDNDSFSLKAINVARQKLKRAFARFKEESSQTKLSASVIARYLDETISSSPGISHFLTGKITFCSFIPMRSIPFKHVFMLGMNDSDFPRQPVYINFDLMHNYFRKGDRSSRNDDRYMFLEALLSAEQSVYISYTGRNPATNELMNPSVLVTELLNYIKQSCTVNINHQQEKIKPSALVEKFICSEAPLDQLHIENFNPNNNPSYQKQWFFKPKQDETQNWNSSIINFCDGMFFSGKLIPNENTKEIEIDLNDLIKFYKAPYKYFVQSVMKIYTPKVDKIYNEEEFIISNLDGYDVKAAFWNNTSLDIDNYLSILQQKGKLPIGGIGTYNKNKYKNAFLPFENFKNKLQDKVKNVAKSIDISFKIIVNDVPNNNEELQELRKSKFNLLNIGKKERTVTVRIKGRIDNIFGKYIFEQNSYNYGYKLVSSSYIKLLALITDQNDKNKSIDYEYLTLDRDNVIAGLSFNRVSIKDILVQFRRLIELYLWSHIKVLPWSNKILDLDKVIVDINKNSSGTKVPVENEALEKLKKLAGVLSYQEKEYNRNKDYNKNADMDYVNGDNLLEYYSIVDAILNDTEPDNELAYLKIEFFRFVQALIERVTNDESNINDVQQLSRVLWEEQ